MLHAVDLKVHWNYDPALVASCGVWKKMWTSASSLMKLFSKNKNAA